MDDCKHEWRSAQEYENWENYGSEHEGRGWKYVTVTHVFCVHCGTVRKIDVSQDAPALKPEEAK